MREIFANLVQSGPYFSQTHLRVNGDESPHPYKTTSYQTNSNICNKKYAILKSHQNIFKLNAIQEGKISHRLIDALMLHSGRFQRFVLCSRTWLGTVNLQTQESQQIEYLYT